MGSYGALSARSVNTRLTCAATPSRSPGEMACSYCEQWCQRTTLIAWALPSVLVPRLEPWWEAPPEATITVTADRLRLSLYDDVGVRQLGNGQLLTWRHKLGNDRASRRLSSTSRAM